MLIVHFPLDRAHDLDIVVSVNAVVVSWKDAADRNESELEAALVIPCKTGVVVMSFISVHPLSIIA